MTDDTDHGDKKPKLASVTNIGPPKAGNSGSSLEELEQALNQVKHASKITREILTYRAQHQRHYYQSLIEQGFTPLESLQLVLQQFAPNLKG